jgi:hypothetical protein
VIDKLDIAILHRPGEIGPSGTIKHERYSVDFLVNGMSLFKATKAGERDLSGCFWIAGLDPSIKAHNETMAEQLTFARAPAIREMDGPIERHRVTLFVCSECADLGCGAITAEIARDGDLIVWSRFAYQNNWQDADGTNWDDFDSYRSIGPFHFAWDSYRTVIHRAAASPDAGSDRTE